MSSTGLRLHWQAFLQALQFLTILPAPGSPGQDARSAGLSLLWYPAVGVLLGFILVACNSLLGFPPLLQAALLLGLWVMLTGGLHLDGLADCADAWTGGLGDREKTLKILRDPLAGTMAVLVLVLLLLLKWAALVVILQDGEAHWLWVLPAMARLSLLLLFTTTPYVRAGGLGEVLARHYSHLWGRRVLVAFTVGMAFILPTGLWVWLCLSLLVVFYLVRGSALRRLDGFTGDVAGAQVELVELALLLVMAGQVVM